MKLLWLDLDTYLHSLSMPSSWLCINTNIKNQTNSKKDLMHIWPLYMFIFGFFRITSKHWSLPYTLGNVKLWFTTYLPIQNSEWPVEYQVPISNQPTNWPRKEGQTRFWVCQMALSFTPITHFCMSTDEINMSWKTTLNLQWVLIANNTKVMSIYFFPYCLIAWPRCV